MINYSFSEGFMKFTGMKGSLLWLIKCSRLQELVVDAVRLNTLPKKWFQERVLMKHPHDMFPRGNYFGKISLEMFPK